MRHAAKAVKAFRFCTSPLVDMVPILEFRWNLVLSVVLVFCPSMSAPRLRRLRTCPILLTIILQSGLKVLGLDLNCSESG
jgi:hypothetical protein